MVTPLQGQRGDQRGGPSMVLFARRPRRSRFALRLQLCSSCRRDARRGLQPPSPSPAGPQPPPRVRSQPPPPPFRPTRCGRPARPGQCRGEPSGAFAAVHPGRPSVAGCQGGEYAGPAVCRMRPGRPPGRRRPSRPGRGTPVLPIRCDSSGSRAGESQAQYMFRTARRLQLLIKSKPSERLETVEYETVVR